MLGARHPAGEGTADRLLLGIQLAELFPDRFRAAPHLNGLDAAGAGLAEGQFAGQPGVVEQPQRRMRRRHRCRVAETVGHKQAPVPFPPRIRLGVAGNKQGRGLDVTGLVEDPQLELEVGPVLRQGIDDLREGVGQRHRAEQYRARPPVASVTLSGMTAVADFRADYTAVTEGAGLLDRSERGKLALSGGGAREFLQGQVTQDIERLDAGHGCYAAFLTQKGKMLGDLRVLATAEELLLDTERVALQPLFNMIRRYSLGYDVALHKRTLERGLLSLIGPLADELVAAASPPAGSERPGQTEDDHLLGQVGPASVRLIRTDVGLDLLIDAADRDDVWEALIGAGAVPVSEAAAECLRIERGRPRYGVDLDETVIPQEAGLNERAVSFTKGCYVGQETVARLFYRGKPNRSLRGLTSAEPLGLGAELALDGRVVGTVTSAADSPRFGPVALALVRREAQVGAIVTAQCGNAVVVALPFS